MSAATLTKPVTAIAGALLSPGTLQIVVLFTFIAVAEVLLNQSIFLCPCDSDLVILYGLSFLIIPAIILFLADFPWKFLQPRPPAQIILSMTRRPLGLALTWLIVALIERKYVRCMVKEDVSDCEGKILVTWLQLTGLYIWLAVVIIIIVLQLCRHRQGKHERSGLLLELKTKYEINEQLDKETLENRIRYGSTHIRSEDDISLAFLQAVQPGINCRTYEALMRHQLLPCSVLAQVRDEDLLSLDVSLAQRCLLRALLAQLRVNPDLLQRLRQTQSKTISLLDPADVI